MRPKSSIGRISSDQTDGPRGVVLVRDAGYLTPLTASGVRPALMGAYVLAGELKAAAGNHRPAWDAYERELRPFVEQKTWEARRTALRLVPGSAIALRILNKILRLFPYQRFSASWFLE